MPTSQADPTAIPQAIAEICFFVLADPVLGMESRDLESSRDEILRQAELETPEAINEKAA